MIIEKLEPYYSSRTSRDGIRWEIRPNLEDVINKINEIIDAINAPTVDAEPVRYGHWIKNDNGTYSCSECHSWIPNEQYYYANYCLHCGAKMMKEVGYGKN